MINLFVILVAAFFMFILIFNNDSNIDDINFLFFRIFPIILLVCLFRFIKTNPETIILIISTYLLICCLSKVNHSISYIIFKIIPIVLAAFGFFIIFKI